MRATIVFILLLGILSCKSTKKYSEVESIESKFVMPDLFSTLNVHYKISNASISDTFNTIVDHYLNNDMELTALGMDVIVNKHDEAKMEIQERKVLTQLPVSIDLTKSTFIKDLKASGVLELSFITELDIDSSWQLVTSTELAMYDWIQQPELSLGGIKLAIGKLANTIIDKSKTEFERQIDQAVKEQFSLRSMILDLMKYVEKPIKVDTLLNSWLAISPETVYLSHIVNDREWTTGNVTVQGKSKIHESKPDNIAALKLPEFAWEQELDDTSHVNLVLDISYEQLNSYIRSEFEGRTFSNDGKSITLNSADLKKRGDRLEVTADVNGSVNGKIIVSAKPVFDNEKQAFSPQDLDVNLKTKNVIHKAGAWIMKGKIKNQLEQAMHFSIKENLEQVQTQIDRELAKYNQDERIEMVIDLRDINVNKFVLDNERIHTFLTFNSYLEIIIHNMSVFQNPTPTYKIRG